MQQKPPLVDHTAHNFFSEQSNNEDSADPTEFHIDMEADSINGSTNSGVSLCVKNWKAVASDNKKMWSTFNETGIFAGAC